MKTDSQLYSLCTRCQRISIHKEPWREERPLHLDTVEISPRICCFEWEGEEELQSGEEVDLQLHLPEGPFRTRATVLTVEPCALLDEGYEMKTCFTYCARFHGELDGSLFASIVGTPRRCRSFAKGPAEDAGELFPE